MMFKIEIEERKNDLKFDAEDTTISEAVETMYPIDQVFYIIWNDVKIRVSFNYDLCEIISDLKRMFNGLNQTEQEGDFEIYWGSSSFFAYWKFTPIADQLKIESYWTSVQADIEVLRKVDNKEILVLKDVFIEEWKKVLFIVREDLLKVGYDHTILKDFQFLDEILNDV